MRHLDRDLRLTAIANLLFALGVGMYLQLLYVYALDLGASRFTVGLLNALMIVSWTAGLMPGAWAARRFRLKPVIVAVWWLTVPAGLSFFLAPSWPWLIPGLVFSGLYTPRRLRPCRHPPTGRRRSSLPSGSLAATKES